MLEIIRRRPEHDARIFELYASVFGEANLERSRRRFVWQYFENPNTPEDGPVIWMARDTEKSGDEILGQMATMPFPMWWGDREVRASAGNDYFVRKDAQGRGIGIALSNKWADEVDVALALGLTPSSYPLFKKIFRDVGPVPAWVKPLDGVAIAKKRLGPILGALAAPGAVLGVALLSRSPALRDYGVDVHETTDVTADFDELWRRARASFATVVRRDARYLKWKYLDCPFREYRILAARRGADLAGYTVIREEGEPGFKRGVIADLFCDTKDEGVQDALIAAAIDEFRQRHLVRAEMYCMNRRLSASLQRHGFRSGTTAVQYCIAYRGASADLLSDLSDWNLVLGDGDLDRA